MQKMHIFLLFTPQKITANNIRAFRRIVLKHTCLPDTLGGSKILYDWKGKQEDWSRARQVQAHFHQWLLRSMTKDQWKAEWDSATEFRLLLYEERPPVLMRALWRFRYSLATKPSLGAVAMCNTGSQLRREGRSHHSKKKPKAAWAPSFQW